MKKGEYKIEYTYSSRDDMRKIKKYILDTFQYREYAENFTNKMKAATKQLKSFPAGLNMIGYRYRGYDIYLEPFRTYLIFYVVDNVSRTVTILRILKDGMNWLIYLLFGFLVRLT